MINVKKNILVVDDNKINRKILSRILQKEGYNVIEAENGKIAFDFLQDENQNISLVMLDLSMPVMTGYEVMHKMTETGIIKAVSVIVTTGSNLQDAEINSLEFGASDFVTKPYNSEIVKRRVKSILRLRDDAALINKFETDNLTGCYNRESFCVHAEEILHANPNQKYDIVCSDVENFKLVNKKYGQESGDALLKFIAQNIENLPNHKDMCLAGRLGADSFVVLRKTVPSLSQADIKKQSSVVLKDSPVKNVVIKYGVYNVTDIGVDVSVMCDCAKMAISSIKHKYGVFSSVYDDKMRDNVEKDHRLTDCMEQALSEHQFKMYLQPKHSSQSGLLSGAEALIRWIHPELGFVSPGDFIPVFERNGFVSNVDYFMWNEACSILAKWKKENKKLIPISVNVSRMDFLTYNLPETICKLVDSYNLPHDLIHLEVTESAYSESPEHIIEAVSRLREKGFLIEMDDFGSGYSSLNMLAELPIDILKLDMRFLKQKNDSVNNKKMTILNSIIILSKLLGFPTIAEGVETKEDLDILRVLGCNYIQGYYYSKPLPVSDFEVYKDKI